MTTAHTDPHSVAIAAPLLLGAMVGSLVAARFETAAVCVAVSVLTAAWVGAAWPARSWFLTLATGATLAIVLNLYLTPGRLIPALSWGSARATAEGLEYGVLLALRLIGATAGVQGLRAAWPGERGADEILRLLGPLRRLRIPIGEVRLVIGLALRFMPLLGEESRRIARLQDLRAGAPARNLWAKLDRLRGTLLPTLVAAVERAERVSLALEARHYRLRPPGAAVLRSRTATGAAWALLGVALFWRG